MSTQEGFTFQGTGKLARIDRFTSKAGKQILTLIFEIGGQWPQTVPIKVFGRLADMASEWKPGDVLDVSGTLGGRDFNGRFYGDISARTVEVISKGAAPADGQGELGAIPDKPADDKDSVPF